MENRIFDEYTFYMEFDNSLEPWVREVVDSKDSSYFSDRQSLLMAALAYSTLKKLEPMETKDASSNILKGKDAKAISIRFPAIKEVPGALDFIKAIVLKTSKDGKKILQDDKKLQNFLVTHGNAGIKALQEKLGTSNSSNIHLDWEMFLKSLSG